MHGAVLSAQSEFFHTLIYGENFVREDRTYTIDEISAPTLRAAAAFCYGADVPAAAPARGLVPLLFAGKRFLMPGLVERVKEELSSRIQASLEDVFDVYDAASQLSLVGLQETVRLVAISVIGRGERRRTVRFWCKYFILKLRPVSSVCMLTLLCPRAQVKKAALANRNAAWWAAAAADPERWEAITSGGGPAARALLALLLSRNIIGGKKLLHCKKRKGADGPSGQPPAKAVKSAARKKAARKGAAGRRNAAARRGGGAAAAAVPPAQG